MDYFQPRKVWGQGKRRREKSPLLGETRRGERGDELRPK